MLTIGIAVMLATASAQVSQTPELLILGSPHLANHNRDIANVQVEDVRDARRQREIERVVDRLAAFRPTHVAVEWPAHKQASLDQRYAYYLAGRYVLSGDEIDQIGLRLAARLHLSRVDAVDWNEMPPGVEADYDFPAWAEAHGRADDWNALQKEAKDAAAAEGRLMTCTPISAWYRRFNAPWHRSADQRRYYDIAGLGDQAKNPGATWVGNWYARNLRILNNLRRFAKLGERVFVVYGAGHGFLLDQQARESGAFRVVDTLAYLPTSRQDSRTNCGR